jgi:starch synthase (maltosyl-transferring)
MSRLSRIKDRLTELLRRHPEVSGYSVPSSWMNARERVPKMKKVNPFEYYRHVIRNIERTDRSAARTGDGGEWSRRAVVYNMFIRSTCAFDHDRNGELDLPVNSSGFRETGTFLKAIALLPHIKRLGANTIHLLPITAIGEDGRKGSLGSPYAIRNPYQLDKMLSEPVLGLDPETEFGGFVEAAHRLGLRVVVEFVFRTAAKDSDWIIEHPEWFYWIRADIPDRDPSSLDEMKFGTPIFSPDELKHIVSRVEQHRLDSLLPPHETYRGMFTEPPDPGRIKREGRRYIGYLNDGTRVRIPGAFADWPPNDVQPPWGDVTYLKFHHHPDFNYAAYNTVRMYDDRLSRPEFVNRALWENIAGIVPHFQKTFGINGVMVDMGHALPGELKRRIIDTARVIDPDFAFWDENFAVVPESKEEGYNAVVGYCWADQHDRPKFMNLLRRCSGESFPLPFFATPETHNTPRAASRPGGIKYSMVTWFLNNFLPAIPFIHGGFELGETVPVNTGLGFSHEELDRLPTDRLPLFSEFAYNWLQREQIAAWISTVSGIRKKHADLIMDPDPRTFLLPKTGNSSVVAIFRTDGKKVVVAVANIDCAHPQECEIELDVGSRTLREAISGKTLRAGTQRFSLPPAGCFLLSSPDRKKSTD